MNLFIRTLDFLEFFSRTLLHYHSTVTEKDNEPKIKSPKYRRTTHARTNNKEMFQSTLTVKCSY